LTARNLELGTSGEDLAARWYIDAGYQLVARNWRCREGELDLVVAGHGAVVFAEVKTRSSDRFGVPAEAVSPTKQRRIRGLALRFLRENPGAGRGRGRLRFDVVSVLAGVVEVIEAAF
jgi:putative endonuclease